MRSWISSCRSWWAGQCEQSALDTDRVPDRWVPAAILLASALGLYLEMVMIRWHATSTHAFAIFKNVSLLSCFLGLGTGFALASRGRRVSLAPLLPLLALQVLMFGLISNTRLGGRQLNPVAEQIIMGRHADRWGIYHAFEGNAFLAGIFLLNALMFIPLGSLTGQLMARRPAIRAYGLNLLGSLLGIGLFFLLSLLWTGPSVWLGLGVLLIAPFLLLTPRLGFVGTTSLAVVLVALGMVGRFDERRYYSPYQVISMMLPRPQDDLPTTIRVNHAFFQDVCDGSPQAVAHSEHHASAADYYNLPYRLRSKPGEVLVVGAGTGNDVAAALRNGATGVTAVEIDPAIQYLGRHIHPEKPYSDPRTKAVLNDARTFLRQTGERFDTIIYGLLDSHTNLGAMTNVRLDSFVYTVEGFREAAARLRDDGMIVVTYCVLSPIQEARLMAMLQQACPEQPVRVFQSPRGLTYAAGPGVAGLPESLPDLNERTADLAGRAGGVEVATDDWPQFYMEKRTYPLTYAIMVVVLLLISAGLVRQKIGFGDLRSARSGIFFFLGAGFMLIETKVITELGLTFGNTWAVIAVAVAGILIMCYAANRVIQHYGSPPAWLAFLLLGLSLLAGLQARTLTGVLPGVVVPVVIPALLTLPLFFAGWIFSGELAGQASSSAALSANLFGAMLGGFLEYNSMFWGLSSLYPLGIALYALAFGCVLLSHRNPGTQRGAEESPRGAGNLAA